MTYASLTDSQLLSQIYRRKNTINSLSAELPGLYLDRRNKKAVMRQAVDAYAVDSMKFHDMYLVTKAAVEADEMLEVVLEELRELQEIQTVQKKEYRRRVNEARKLRQNAVERYLYKLNRQKAYDNMVHNTVVEYVEETVSAA